MLGKVRMPAVQRAGNVLSFCLQPQTSVCRWEHDEPHRERDQSRTQAVVEVGNNALAKRDEVEQATTLEGLEGIVWED